MSEIPEPGLALGPDWLLAGFDNAADRFNFARVTRQSYQNSAFLDHRIQPLPTETMSLSGRQVDEALPHARVARSAWIFHTGFCCSTLLATCLDHPGSTLVLREPLVLSRLAHAKRKSVGGDTAVLKIATQRVTGLCERSYPGESLLIKPSNFANTLIADLIPAHAAEPRRKAILMTSSLDSLLVSILKKRSEAEALLPGFLDALLQDSDYPSVTGLADALADALADGLAGINKLHLLQQSVLFWHCQRYFLQRCLAQPGADNFMSLSMERFLAEPEAVLSDVSGFLELELSAGLIQKTVESGAFRRHSKQALADYGPDAHHREQQATRARFAAEIAAALAWAEPLLKRLPVEPFDAFEAGG